MSARHTCRCVICGQTFSARHPSSQTCSPECAENRRREITARCRQKRRLAEKASVTEKWCHRCRETRPAAAFGKDIWTKDGLSDRCKACRREYMALPEQRERSRERKAAWYLLHYERERERQNGRYQTDEAHREARKRAALARYHADPSAKNSRERDARAARRALEAEDARRCACGLALADGDEEGPWFCRAGCKAAMIRGVLSGDLRDLILRLRARHDPQRIAAEEEALIGQVARKTASLWAGKGRAVDDGDLLASAHMGAWNAWLTYDETRGSALQSWLITGARREVLEALRAADPLTRSERKAYRERQAVDPDAALPRTLVSLDAQAAEAALADADPLVVGDRLAGDEDEAGAVIDRVAAEQTAARIWEVVGTGGGKWEGEVVRLMGLEGLTMKQVSAMLGISEARVHQVWAAAKARIVRALAA